jgi:beta-phosphoglucomutase-like phosphatase (HAD superfamily)
MTRSRKRVQLPKPGVDLVIFDCDGVLVDSEVISCRAHAETLTRHGYPITSDQVLDRFLGVSDREARLTVEAELGRHLPDDFEDQVKRGKPAPDLFLFAAEQMRVSPQRCIVIEDSVPGITGACAAGMTVLGFHGGSHCRPGYADTLRAAGAQVTFDDMRQLPGLIGQIGTD